MIAISRVHPPHTPGFEFMFKLGPIGFYYYYRSGKKGVVDFQWRGKRLIDRR